MFLKFYQVVGIRIRCILQKHCGKKQSTLVMESFIYSNSMSLELCIGNEIVYQDLKKNA